MPKLGIKEHEIVKISKKRGLLKFFRPILGFYTKKSPQSWWFTHFMKTFWDQIYDCLQNRNCFFLILHWVSFPTNIRLMIKNWFQKNNQFFLDSSLGIPYIVLWFNVCNKELLALRNNFRVTKKFLIAKFDCTMLK